MIVLFPIVAREYIAQHWPSNPWGFNTRPQPMADQYDAEYEGLENLDWVLEMFPDTFTAYESQLGQGRVRLMMYQNGAPASSNTKEGCLTLEEFVARGC